MGTIMRYIRTKNGRIIEIEENMIVKVYDGVPRLVYKINPMICVLDSDDDILKQANTIEELICDDDILYLYDLYPDVVLVVEGNIKPFGYDTAIKLKEWLGYKHKFDLFTKDNKGNYIKRAKANKKGEMELL